MLEGMVDIWCLKSNILYQTYQKGLEDQSWSLVNQWLWGLVENLGGWLKGLEDLSWSLINQCLWGFIEGVQWDFQAIDLLLFYLYAVVKNPLSGIIF